MRNLLIIIATCAAFAAIVVVASADGDGSVPPGAAEEPIAAVQPEAEDALSVLEDHRTSADVMRDGTADVIEATPTYGSNPDLSRLAIGNASHSLFVVPAREHVCMAFTTAEKVTVGCPDTDAVAAGQAGPMTVSLEGGAAAVLGLVPDGIESVTVGTGATDTTVVAVDDNAFYFAVPAGTALRDLHYSAPSGQVEFPLTDPRHAFDETEQ